MTTFEFILIISGLCLFMIWLIGKLRKVNKRIEKLRDRNTIIKDVDQ